MQQVIPPSFFVSQLSCMSAKFSPFDVDKIAITQADNFGISGKGKLLIGQLQPNAPIKILFNTDELDAIFDCSWNEADPNILAIGCGNGFVKIWNVGTQQILNQFQESKNEVQCTEFSHKNPNILLASNLDGITRLYDITAQKALSHFQSHKGCAYTCTWHPIQSNIFATSGNDGALRLWDLNSPTNKNIASVKAHMSDTLSCDFNKYEEIIATSSSDKTIKLWDLRNLKAPLQTLMGHRHPVKRVKFSPHEATILGSASYDMSVMIWNISDISNPLMYFIKQISKNHPKHSEFVVGLDFSIHTEKQICSASWDGKVMVWQWDQEQPSI